MENNNQNRHIGIIVRQTEKELLEEFNSVVDQHGLKTLNYIKEKCSYDDLAMYGVWKMEVFYEGPDVLGYGPDGASKTVSSSENDTSHSRSR